MFDFLKNTILYFEPLSAKLQEGILSLGSRILISALTLLIGIFLIGRLKKFIKKILSNTKYSKSRYLNFLYKIIKRCLLNGKSKIY